MLLGDVIVELCDTPIYSYQAGAWVLAPVKCRVPPYDRFISDRAFGQKKRLVQTPGGQLLPAANYYRPGSDTSRTYMVESVNEDQDGSGEYLNVYMMREASDACEILTQQITPRPSGTPKKEWVVDSQIWVDFDRFGVLRSDELDGVDYTSFTVTLPTNIVLPGDCRLRIDNALYAVTENFVQLELRQLRVRGINGQP